jgi:tetratricopeptide (TPR) repeat protein
MRLGRFEDAIKSYEEGLRIKPNYGFLWHNKGSALYELRRFEEAIKSFDEVLKIDPQDTEAIIYKNNVLEKLNKKR